jgi:hypothetical protein
MSSTTNDSTLLDDKVALVSVAISIFSGYRRATREQIQALGGNLPTCGAVTEGSIKVFPGDALKDAVTIRRRVFRKLGALGVKALESSTVFAIPRDRLPEAETILEAENGAFRAEVASLDANYETIFEKHVADNALAAQIIRQNKIDKAAAIARMQFRSTLFRIQPLQEQGVKEILDGLGRQLFEEVAAEISELARHDSMTSKAKVGQKTLRPIKAALAKMNGFEFLDPAVAGTMRFVQDILSSLPSNGWIEDGPQDRPLHRLHRLVEVMSDADALVTAGARVCNGANAVDVLCPPSQSASPSATSASATDSVTIAPAASRTNMGVALPGTQRGTAVLSAAVPPRLSVGGGRARAAANVANLF